MPVVSRAAHLVAPVASQVDMTMAFLQTIRPGTPFFPAPPPPSRGIASLSAQPRPNTLLHSVALCSIREKLTQLTLAFSARQDRTSPHFSTSPTYQPSKQARLPVPVQAVPPCRAQDPVHGTPSLCRALPFHYPHLQTVSIRLSTPRSNHFSP